jgi:Aromatic-ring-opening dioxygenase LigAB, LigA subunit
MSVNGLESAIYSLGASGSARKRYGEDKAAFLSRYALTDDECSLIMSEDVAALFRRGVNPMALMGFYIGFHGPRALPDYLKLVPSLASTLGEQEPAHG